MYNIFELLRYLIDLIDEYNNNSICFNLCKNIINEKINYNNTFLLEEEYKKERNYRNNMLDIGTKIYDCMLDLDKYDKKLFINFETQLEKEFYFASLKRFCLLGFEIGMSSYGGMDLNIDNYSNGYNEAILYKHASIILDKVLPNKELSIEDKNKYHIYIKFIIDYFNGNIDVNSLKDYLSETDNLIYRQDLLDILKILESKELSRNR